MDRSIVYDGALPQTTDILNTNIFAMLGQAFANRAMLGDATAVHGLACNATSPASLQVTVGAGSIYALDEIDATAYGDLGTNTTTVLKQGINHSPVSLTITPPSTSGYSQVFLVQVELQDVDAGTEVLSYYNAGNPTQPFSGPDNDGQSQFTQRTCVVNIELKVGVAASTGSQVTPSPDAGYVGLYAITVANGASTVTSANISELTTAPYFPTLPSVPGKVQAGTWIYAVDTGVANALVANVQPAPTALVAGMGVKIKVANGNTSTTTFNLNGLGAVAVHRASGAGLSSGDINAGMVLCLVYDGSAWQIENFEGFTSSTTNNNTYVLSIPYATDSGSTNAVVADFSPSVTSLSAGNPFEVKIADTNTGASTLTCNSLSAVAIHDRAGNPLQAGALIAGQVAFFIYDGTYFQLIGSSATNIAAGLAGTYHNKLGVTSSNTTRTWTADSIIVSDGTNATAIKSLNITINSASSGANGVDSGSLTDSAPCYEHVIYNPTTATAAGLFSLSRIAPTLPSGYTQWARLGGVCLDSSGHFYRVEQENDDATVVQTASTNTASLPVLASGAIGTWSPGTGTVTWSAVSVAAYLPASATRVRFSASNVYRGSGNACQAGVAPNNTYGAAESTNPAPIILGSAGNQNDAKEGDFVLESSDIYAAVSAGSSFGLLLMGWTDRC